MIALMLTAVTASVLIVQRGLTGVDSDDGDSFSQIDDWDLLEVLMCIS